MFNTKFAPTLGSWKSSVKHKLLLDQTRIAYKKRSFIKICHLPLEKVPSQHYPRICSNSFLKIFHLWRNHSFHHVVLPCFKTITQRTSLILTDFWKPSYLVVQLEWSSRLPPSWPKYLNKLTLGRSKIWSSWVEWNSNCKACNRWSHIQSIQNVYNLSHLPHFSAGKSELIKFNQSNVCVLEIPIDLLTTEAVVTKILFRP